MRTLNAKENDMKNTIKLLGIIALAAVFGFTMIACSGGGGDGKLSGTYELDDRAGYTRTFSGSKHTFSGPGFSNEGTFTISGDELTITDSDGDVTVFKFKLSGNKLEIANVGARLDDPNQWQKLTKK
jgi:hypothetical protein